jgi:hypothetical protein
MTISVITGYIGSGKTLLMTFLLNAYQKAGKKIISNYYLDFPHQSISFEQIQKMQLSNCVLGLDELTVWLDSRLSMTKQNRIISYFVLQTRKRDVDLLATTQDFGMLDLRLRRQTNYIIESEKVDFDTFHYTLRRLGDWRTTDFYLKPKETYNLFDTTQIINIPERK